MTPPAPERAPRSGLTLLEAILALSIAAWTAIATLGLVATSTRATATASLRQRSVDLAADAVARWRTGANPDEVCPRAGSAGPAQIACTFTVRSCTGATLLDCSRPPGASRLEEGTLQLSVEGGPELRLVVLRYAGRGALP